MNADTGVCPGAQDNNSKCAQAWLAAQSGQGEYAATSALGRVELMRVVARQGEPGQAERARYLLDGLDILPLAEPVIALAETIGPPTLRSLDAIHLAAAAQIKRELTAFDGRLPRGRYRNRITRRRSRVTVPPTRRPALSRQSGSGCCCQLRVFGGADGGRCISAIVASECLTAVERCDGTKRRVRGAAARGDVPDGVHQICLADPNSTQ